MLKIIKIDSTGDKKPTLKEMREYIKNHGGYYNLWSEDNWLKEGIKYADPDRAGISTEMLYNALTEKEVKIIYK